MFTGGREVIYVAGGQQSSTTAEILDYTQTEDFEQSKWSVWVSAHKFKYEIYEVEGLKYPMNFFDLSWSLMS